jgi:hypothetical protein
MLPLLYEKKSLPDGKDPNRSKKNDSVTLRAVDTAFQDPWSDWQPRWSLNAKQKSHQTSDMADAHDWQETHSPTEPVSLRSGDGRTRHATQRRVTDAKLWDNMTTQQQDAALEIALAFEVMGRGLGYATSDWTRVPGGGGNAGEAHGRLINDYIGWTVACHKNKISHSMIIDILVYGFSCRALDRDRRVKTGTARQNLIEGLILYAKLRGWQKDDRRVD